MKNRLLLTLAVLASALDAWWQRQSHTLALGNTDTFTGTLYTKRHSAFTVTPTTAAVVPGSGQGFTHKRSADQTMVKVGGVVVNRSTGPKKDTLSLRWVWTAAAQAAIAAYVAPAIDEVVAVTGLPVTEQNKNYNIVSWETTGQEGNDITGTCELDAIGGATGGTALAALA